MTDTGVESATSPEEPDAGSLPVPSGELPAGESATEAPTLGAEERQAYDHLAGSMQTAGVASDVGTAALNWLFSNPGELQPGEEAKHRFDFSGANLSPEEAQYLDAFGNAMHDAGATQGDVDAALRVYDDMRRQGVTHQVEEQRELERLDQEDAQRTAGILRAEWGDEYAANVRLINQYLDQLPAAEREAIENETLDDGSLALNSPERLGEFATLARGGDREGSEAPREELNKLRTMMQDPTSEYWRGPNAERNQARYRDLVSGTAALQTNAGQQGSGQHKPNGSSEPLANDAEEFARLRKLMADPSSEYWRGPRAEEHQARYRKLLAARG